MYIVIQSVERGTLALQYVPISMGDFMNLAPLFVQGSVSEELHLKVILNHLCQWEFCVMLAGRRRCWVKSLLFPAQDLYLELVTCVRCGLLTAHLAVQLSPNSQSWVVTS